MNTAVRRTLKNKINTKAKNKRVVTELKGTKTCFEHKQYFFRHIKSDDWSIYSVVLNKDRIKPHLRTKTGKAKLYNFLSRFILEKLPLRQTFTNVHLVVDRSKNRNEIKDFNRYLQNQIEALLPLNTGFKVEHLNSQEDPGLQCIDLFCWGIFRKYEYNDKNWFDVYCHKIKFITEYLPNIGA